MANKKIVNAKTIVENDVPFVYDNCLNELAKLKNYTKNTPVLNEKRQEKIRGFMHQLAGNVGNKILSITMNDDDIEIKSEKLNFLAGKAAEKTVETCKNIKETIIAQNKVAIDIVSKTVDKCAFDVFKRHKAATKETVSAVFEKQELKNFKVAKKSKTKIAG